MKVGTLFLALSCAVVCSVVTEIVAQSDGGQEGGVWREWSLHGQAALQVDSEWHIRVCNRTTDDGWVELYCCPGYAGNVTNGCKTSTSVTNTIQVEASFSEWDIPETTSRVCSIGNRVYEPGEVATVACKTCVCTQSQGWRCVPTLYCQISPQREVCSISNRFFYNQGMIQRRGCNYCICSGDTWNCTSLICPPNDDAEVGVCRGPGNESFADGTRVRLDCNICVCTFGKWDCTHETCPASDATQEPAPCVESKFRYNHGSTKANDCNQCVCNDGSWACTHKYCTPSEYPNSTCQAVTPEGQGSYEVRAGETAYMETCSVCICNAGSFVCSSKSCNADEQHRSMSPTTTITTATTTVPTTTESATASPEQPTQAATSDDQPCFTMRDSSIEGVSVAKDLTCESDGWFAAKQCIDLLFIFPCYCVSKQGDVLRQFSQYSDHPDCEQIRADAAERTSRQPTTPPPTTTEEPASEAEQAGLINGVVRNETSETTTTTSVNYPTCAEQLASYNEMPSWRLRRIFAQRAQCDATGNYELKQCYYLVGYCMCVDQITGVEIEGSMRFSDDLDCSVYHGGAGNRSTTATNPSTPTTLPPALMTPICNTSPRPRPGCVHLGDFYGIGRTFYRDCNRCTCFGPNVMSCNKKRCFHHMCYLEGEPLLSAVHVSRDRCTRCECERGDWSCQNVCSGGTPLPDTTTTTAPPTGPADLMTECTLNGITYLTGQTFYSECNRCWCLSNGKPACTRIGCPRNMCYMEGDPTAYEKAKNRTADGCKECKCYRGQWSCRDICGDTTTVTTLATTTATTPAATTTTTSATTDDVATTVVVETATEIVTVYESIV